MFELHLQTPTLFRTPLLSAPSLPSLLFRFLVGLCCIPQLCYPITHKSTVPSLLTIYFNFFTKNICCPLSPWHTKPLRSVLFVSALLFVSQCLRRSHFLCYMPLPSAGCCVVSARPSRLERRFPEYWNGTGAGREIHWEKPAWPFPLSITHAHTAAHTRQTAVMYVIMPPVMDNPSWTEFMVSVQGSSPL